MGLFDRFRKRSVAESDLFGHLPPPKPARISSRRYASAKQSRLTTGFIGSATSADAELADSLTQLRGRSRQLVRDTSYAKRAQTLIVNNIIGTGVGMQAQVRNRRGELNKRTNAGIEAAWKLWCKKESAHIGGRLHFKHIERQIMAQVFEAGEVLIRMHTAAPGRSVVPLTLELIESERMADEFQSTYLNPGAGNEVRLGVEVDRYYKPIAYYIRQRHPQDTRFTGTPEMIERVPASDILHITLVDRWPQTRGVPWMHAIARRLNDMDAYSEAEIIRARTQALTAGAIETPESIEAFAEIEEDGSATMEMEAGMYKRLRPGEKLTPGAVNAPNPALDPFMRYMLREIAAGVGVSYESLSRDYSQSNYSSSRLSILDDRDLWRFFQSFYITDFREVLHERWLQAAVFSGAIPQISAADFASNMDGVSAVRYKPRGWSWVDPTKEVKAYKDAVKAGFTTVGEVIAATASGADLEDMLAARRDELDMMEDMDLEFDTSPNQYVEDDEPEVDEPEPPVMPANIKVVKS